MTRPIAATRLRWAILASAGLWSLILTIITR